MDISTKTIRTISNCFKRNSSRITGKININVNQAAMKTDFSTRQCYRALAQMKKDKIVVLKKDGLYFKK